MQHNKDNDIKPNKAAFCEWLDVYVRTEFDSDVCAIDYWLEQANRVPSVAAQAFRYLSVPACNKTCSETIGKSAAFNSLRHFSDKTDAVDDLFFLNLNFSSCPALQEFLF